MGKLLTGLRDSLALYGALTWPSLVIIVYFAVTYAEPNAVLQIAVVTALFGLPVFVSFDLAAALLRVIRARLRAAQEKK